MGMQHGTAALEDIYWFLTKVLLPYDTAIMLLGIYPEELKTYGKTCTWMFIAALAIIGKTWKQPKRPSVGEWIKCGTSRKWTIIQHQKEMSCQALKRHEGTLNVYY